MILSLILSLFKAYYRLTAILFSIALTSRNFDLLDSISNISTTLAADSQRPSADVEAEAEAEHGKLVVLLETVRKELPDRIS